MNKHTTPILLRRARPKAYSDQLPKTFLQCKRHDCIDRPVLYLGTTSGEVRVLAVMVDCEIEGAPRGQRVHHSPGPGSETDLIQPDRPRSVVEPTLDQHHRRMKTPHRGAFPCMRRFAVRFVSRAAWSRSRAAAPACDGRGLCYPAHNTGCIRQAARRVVVIVCERGVP